jgi:hypothetical protein
MMKKNIDAAFLGLTIWQIIVPGGQTTVFQFPSVFSGPFRKETIQKARDIGYNTRR